MRAIQTRSPIHLFYEKTDLFSVNISIWVSDSIEIDMSSKFDYSLTTTAINELASFEIAELIRSKNNYIFDADFYTRRDTAKYVLVKAVLLDDTQTQLELKYDLLRIRDGYVKRTSLPQIYKNLIDTDPNTYDTVTNTTITDSTDTPFGTSESYLLEDTSNEFNIRVEQTLNLTGVYTFSVFVKRNNATNLYSLGDSFDNRVFFDLLDENVDSVVGTVIAYDLTTVGTWTRISVCLELDSSSSFRFQSEQPTDVQSILFFNPTITKGNHINQTASDLILQDNTTIFSDGVISPLIGFDLKNASSYSYALTPITFTGQSEFSVVSTGNLLLTDLNSVSTSQQISLVTLDECKYTPVKVSFVNRFGVIQDLVFFKKRVDTINTDKESYKANVLQGSEYYPHIGMSQNISKSSQRKVTLNTGFYSEDFNTVFEQLQNSLYYWIDDEPANLEGSRFDIKTKVNDKLINYTFDFIYSNEDINTIR